MTGYEIYTLILCLVVFVALTAFFATLITYIVKLYIKLIRGGFADDSIQKQREAEAKQSAVFCVLEKAVAVLLLAVTIALFVFSLTVKLNENKPVERSVLKVVQSSSMSLKDENNKYLFENNLNDQLQMFDVIRIAPLPAESDLKLYDIVVYEVDGLLLVHRIVGINEPDATHAERWFVLQGDANRYTDKFPVRYSQMKGIYDGHKIAYVGSFVMFLNSPAGYLCILLVVVACVAYPLIERKLKKEFDARCLALAAAPAGDAPQVEAIATETFATEPTATEVAPSADEHPTPVTDEHTVAFVKPTVETLAEKYLKLTDEQKRYYDEIVAYAAAIEGNKQFKNDCYEEYKLGKNRLVRVLVRRDVVTCEYLMPNENFKKYLDGNKVRVKYAPMTLKVTDEATLQAAKDSIDIAKRNIEEEIALKKAGEEGLTTAIIQSHNATLDEKFAKLSKEQKRFYNEIAAYAAAIEGNKRIKNDRYEEYKSGNNRLVRLLVKRDVIVCEYLMPNEDFKKYADGNKVRVKYAPMSLKVTDETSLQAAKDSIDIAKRIIEEEKLYKKELAKQRRREKRGKPTEGTEHHA